MGGEKRRGRHGFGGMDALGKGRVKGEGRGGKKER